MLQSQVRDDLKGLIINERNLLVPALKSPLKVSTKAWHSHLEKPTRRKPYINISLKWNSLTIMDDCHADVFFTVAFFSFWYSCPLTVPNQRAAPSIFFGRPSYVMPRCASRGNVERSKCARSPTRHYSIGRIAVESDAWILRTRHVPLTI